jgi:hypothetical protein
MAKLVLFSTRAEGYWFKAPSWSDGQKFEMGAGKALDLDASDLAELERQVGEGHPLRFEVEAAKPEKKK